MGCRGCRMMLEKARGGESGARSRKEKREVEAAGPDGADDEE